MFLQRHRPAHAGLGALHPGSTREDSSTRRGVLRDRACGDAPRGPQWGGGSTLASSTWAPGWHPGSVSGRTGAPAFRPPAASVRRSRSSRLAAHAQAGGRPRAFRSAHLLCASVTLTLGPVLLLGLAVAGPRVAPTPCLPRTPSQSAQCRRDRAFVLFAGDLLFKMCPECGARVLSGVPRARRPSRGAQGSLVSPAGVTAATLGSVHGPTLVHGAPWKQLEVLTPPPVPHWGSRCSPCGRCSLWNIPQGARAPLCPSSGCPWRSCSVSPSALSVARAWSEQVALWTGAWSWGHSGRCGRLAAGTGCASVPLWVLAGEPPPSASYNQPS